MYDVLQLSWGQMMESDYLFKCNSQKKIVEIKGVNMGDTLSNDSDIVIFYNLYTGNPYLLVEKTATSVDVPDVSSITVPSPFSVDVYCMEDEDAVEVICVHQDIRDAIDKLDSDANTA